MAHVSHEHYDFIEIKNSLKFCQFPLNNNEVEDGVRDDDAK